MKSLRELAPYQEPPRGPMRGASSEANPIRRMPAVNPEQTFFHFDLLRALELHRGLALGIFLSAMVLCGAYLARRWHTYKASSLVYVHVSPRLMENGQAQSWPSDANSYESYMQQQIQNVTREDVLAAAVRRIPGFQGAKESDQAAADRLGGNILVERVSTGYQIAITATASSGAEAAQMANAVAGSFIDSTTKELRSGDTERIALLAEERDRVSQELASDRAEQDVLNKQLGVASVGTAAPDPYDEQISEVRTELVKARTERDEAAAKLTATTGGGPSSAALDAAADEIVAADPGLVSMKTALNKRRSDLISQMANLTPQHPLYKQDADELAKINSSLETMSKDLRAKAGAQIEQKLKSDLERTAGVEDRLNAQLAQMTRTAGGATPRLQRASELATDIARLQNRFATVDEQYRNLTIESAAPGAVYLSAAAIAPLHADRKKVYRNALIVLLAGFIFALAAALVAHNLDPRIYIAADVERVLGFAPMALLPDVYEVGTGVAEEYMLRLAAAVEHAHQQGHLNSCIVTGVAPGAGTTTVSTRVSNMLQAMGRSTALVDAVGAPPEENIDAGNVLVHIPRGARSTALLQQMTAGNDDTIVISDTAPLLISGETEFLARFVDSAIVVIESGTTTKAQLREVAQTLERLDVTAVGFVLNRISMAKANSAFRGSVHAVEKHLKAQARAFERNGMPRVTPAEDAAEVDERHQAFAVEPSEQQVHTAGVEVLEDAAYRTEESIPPHETMLVAGPQPTDEQTADEEPGNHKPPAWQSENLIWPDLEENPAGISGRLEMHPFEPRSEEVDGFLPWEAEPNSEIRRRFAGDSPLPYGGGTAGARNQAIVPDSAPASSTEDADPIPLGSGAPQEPAAELAYTEFLQEPLETAPPIAEAPSSHRDTMQPAFPGDVSQPAFESSSVAAQPAPPDPFPAATEIRALNRQAIPARPARGREGVQVVLGGRTSAPLTGEEVPNAWRERLQSEVEAACPAVPSEEEAYRFVGNLEPPQYRLDPFSVMREAGARREPLKEWWEELIAPLETSPAPEDHPQEFPPAAVAPEFETPAAASQAGANVEYDEALDRAASRLGGLRNLLVSLGIQNFHQGAEQRKAEAQAQAPTIPARPVYTPPVTSEEPAIQSSESVTARPEFMPPQPQADAEPREQAPRPPKTPIKSPRVTTWDSPDDVDILPSRRGQYRRNH